MGSLICLTTLVLQNPPYRVFRSNIFRISASLSKKFVIDLRYCFKADFNKLKFIFPQLTWMYPGERSSTIAKLEDLNQELQ